MSKLNQDEHRELKRQAQKLPYNAWPYFVMDAPDSKETSDRNAFHDKAVAAGMTRFNKTEEDLQCDDAFNNHAIVAYLLYKQVSKNIVELELNKVARRHHEEMERQKAEREEADKFQIFEDLIAGADGILDSTSTTQMLRTAEQFESLTPGLHQNSTEATRPADVPAPVQPSTQDVQVTNTEKGSETEPPPSPTTGMITRSTRKRKVKFAEEPAPKRTTQTLPTKGQRNKNMKSTCKPTMTDDARKASLLARQSRSYPKPLYLPYKRRYYTDDMIAKGIKYNPNLHK